MANFLKDLKISTKRYKLDSMQRTVTEAPASRDPENIRIGSIVPKRGAQGGGQAELSDVDLTQIGQAYYSDSYISRAINKIVGLMFKEGWHFTSKNVDALHYIETRFRLIEESTLIKTNELLREIGLNYVLYGNAVIVKTRGTENTGGLNYQGYYSQEPISGFFAASPESLSLNRDDTGTLENYIIGEQNSEIEFDPADVLHMTYQKPSGLAYGVPYLTNTIRDVLVLRQIEQTVTNILYRNLHPLQVYTVGRPEPGMEARQGEIDEVEDKVSNSPLDSMFIVPERHKIESIHNNYLDANGYLKYFRQRVFTGLGVSESTMGIGDTANRSTADNQSSDLIDLVKDFQQNFMSQFQRLIDELLFEGGFDPTLDPEVRVNFEFIEIEQSTKIARENHEIQKYLSNVQSIDEARLNMGYEYVETFERFYDTIVTDSKPIDNSGTVSNKDQPENQHGKQDAPKELKNANKLTVLNEEVNLQTDGHDFLLKKAWLTTKELMSQQESCKESQMVDVFASNLPTHLFNSIQEKNTFARLTLQSLSNNGTISLKQDNLYRYEDGLIESYKVFNQLHMKGENSYR